MVLVDEFDICSCKTTFSESYMDIGDNYFCCPRCMSEFKVKVDNSGIYSTTLIVGEGISLDRIDV